MVDARNDSARWLRATAIALGFAIALAAFTGIRSPNMWSATLQTVSLTDGFYKRFLVGTLLRPLAQATDYNYWTFATFSFAILAALLCANVVATVRSQLPAQRLLVIAWFVLPTGGFLFHTVGYFDHVLYLAFFCAAAALARHKLVAATAVMAAMPLVHEISLLTVLPLFGVWLLHATTLKRAVLLTAIPTAINLVVLLIPAASDTAIATIIARVEPTDLPYRIDAYTLFQHSLSQARAAYDLGEQLERVLPVALLVGISFALVVLTDDGRPRGPHANLRFAACIAAVVAPLGLAFGGWDSNRWVVFLMTNYCIVTWLYLRVREQTRLSYRPVLVLFTTLLVFTRVPVYYFDGIGPRQLGVPELRELLDDLRDGRLLRKPHG